MIEATAWATRAGGSGARGTGDVEGVQRLTGIRGDVGGAHRDAGCRQRDADVVEQPGPVLSPAPRGPWRRCRRRGHHQGPRLAREPELGLTEGRGLCDGGGRGWPAAPGRRGRAGSGPGRWAPASGTAPPGDSTCHSFAAIPSTVRRMAERTMWPWAASSPAVSAKRPTRSRSVMSRRCGPPSRGPATRLPRPTAATSRGTRCLAAAPSAATAPRSAGLRAVEPVATATASWSRSVARQSVHASGPAADASASVRARSSSKTCRSPPTASTAASMVAGSWWSRRVASSMRVRCSRTSVTSTSTSRGAKPQRVDDRARRARRPVGRVVVRAAHLADVVEQRGEQQQVGPGDPTDQPGGADDGLDEVPVDGVPVHGVALRPAAHRRPLRDPRVDDRRPGRGPPTRARAPGRRRAGRREGRAATGGHGAGGGGSAAREVVEGGRGDGQARPRSDDAAAQRHPRVGLGEPGRARARPRRRWRRARARAAPSAGGGDRPAGCGPAGTARPGAACRRARTRWRARPRRRR